MDVLKFQDATIAIELLEKEGYPLDDILMMCRMNNIHYGEVNIDWVRKELDSRRGIK